MKIFFFTCVCVRATEFLSPWQRDIVFLFVFLVLFFKKWMKYATCYNMEGIVIAGTFFVTLLRTRSFVFYSINGSSSQSLNHTYTGR